MGTHGVKVQDKPCELSSLRAGLPSALHKQFPSTFADPLAGQLELIRQAV